MRIALLNLPYDNNYGGNLQRYALMKVLHDMGHDVTHLNLRFDYHLPWYKIPILYGQRLIKRVLLKEKLNIRQERYYKEKYENKCSITNPFYLKYIRHTEPIIHRAQLKQHTIFDAFIVGSDQVWRKKIAGKYLQSMFFDFLSSQKNIKRLAYGVSMGVEENELKDAEIKRLSKLYERLDAVSVRECSALNLFKQYGWNKPQAVSVLDPTLLLCKDDYISLINNETTIPSKGNMFCYILDKTIEKTQIINEKAEELNLKPYKLGLKDENGASIEQWLRSFADAEFVITDSYHGLLFSIIFNKPFFLIRNRFRGNARFNSVMESFGITDDGTNVNWEIINDIIREKREESIAFLKNNLA